MQLHTNDEVIRLFRLSPDEIPILQIVCRNCNIESEIHHLLHFHHHSIDHFISLIHKIQCQMNVDMKFSHHFFFGFLLSMHILFTIQLIDFQLICTLHFVIFVFFFFFPTFFQFSIVFCNLNGDALNESQLTKSIFFSLTK